MQKSSFVWYTKQMMNLSQAKKNTVYIIESIQEDMFEQSRLEQMGFCQGEEVQLINKAPIFSDPLLYKVGETRIALTKSEARLVAVSAKGSSK